jgi:hypothetical protein
MTDQQQDISTTDRIATALNEAQEAVATIAINIAALNSVDDGKRAEIIGITNQWIEYAGSQLATMSALAPAALAVADEAIQQRDAIARELSGLIKAINSCDYEDSRLAGFVEAVQQDQFEYFEESGGFYSECPGCEAIATGAEVDHDAVNGIIAALLYQLGDLPPEFAHRFNDFARPFLADIDACLNKLEA